MRRGDREFDFPEIGGEATSFDKGIMTSANQPMELSRLQALLEAYGADTKRWPHQYRQVAEAMLASHAEARAMWDEARTLELLLDHAPLRDAAPQADLAARIVARATSERPAMTAAQPLPDNVVPLRRSTPQTATPPAVRGVGSRRSDWRTGGVLAASLMLGLLIGSFGLTASMLDLDDDDSIAAISADGMFTGPEEDRI